MRHPDWGVINADGSTNDRATSFFSPYADQLLIPQLRELAGDYGVDGAWIDGECWAAAPDWSEPALKAFRETTGITSVPRKPGDPHWHEFLDFNRELFRRYLRHYIGEVKRTHPQFELCSNWAYTDHMAEPVSAPLDFLSGDYSPDDSVNSARVSARYLARQGVAWDLMAWSFSLKVRDQGQSSQKTAVQLQREAAVVLALGGGFQAYFKQKRDGSVFDEQLPVMAEVAKFCRDRQAVCHHAEAVPQVALLLSTAGHYRRINGLYPRDLGRLSGVLQALLESQYSVEVLGEHHLAGRMPEYPLIVVPEWEYLETEFREQLVAYVKAGGNLLLIGPRTAALFESDLGVTLNGKPKVESRYLAHHDTLTAVKGLMQDLECGTQTKSLRPAAHRRQFRVPVPACRRHHSVGPGANRRHRFRPRPGLRPGAFARPATFRQRSRARAVSPTAGRGARFDGRGRFVGSESGPVAGEPRQHRRPASIGRDHRNHSTGRSTGRDHSPADEAGSSRLWNRAAGRCRSSIATGRSTSRCRGWRFTRSSWFVRTDTIQRCTFRLFPCSILVSINRRGP